MRYKGRITAIIIIFLSIASHIYIDYQQYHFINQNIIILSLILDIPFLILVSLYDKAKYYSSEVERVSESGHVVLWKWDGISNSPKITGASEVVYGYSKKEMQNDRHLWKKVVLDEDKKIADDFDNNVRHGREVTKQYRIIHKNGNIKWVQNSATPIQNKHGQVIEVNGATIDITKQKEKDEVYKKIIDTSPITNIIIKDDKIIYSNNEGLKLVGATSLNELTGRNISDFLPQNQFTFFREQYKKLLYGELDKLPPFEFNLRRLNGEFIKIESSGIKTVFNEQEVVLAVIKDITEETNTKLKLMEAEEKYRSISDESLVGVYMLDNEEVTYINKEVERILGYTSDEISNINLFHLFIKDEQPRVLKHLQQLYTNEIGRLEKQYIMLTKSKEQKDVEVRAVLTTINNKKVVIGTIIDITNEKLINGELKKALKNLEELKFAMDQSAIVTITNKKGEIIYVNQKFCDISKYSKKELIGNTHKILDSDYHDETIHKNIWNTIESGITWKGDIKYKNKEGNFYWVDTTIVPFLDENNEPYQFIGIQYDITEKILYQQEVNYMAFRDSLTGLLNRNSLNKYLDEILSEDNDISIGVLFIDLDRFKSVNDTLGHKFGDLMLKEAAQVLLNCLGRDEIIFRYGGDEFVIVLNHATHAKIQAQSQKIIKAFQEGLLLQNVEVFTTPSIGISFYPVDGKTTEELLKTADMAMYSAKESGKNNYKFFDSSIANKIQKRLSIERELRKSLKENHLSLHLQPKVNLNTNEIVGYESLIRWFHPKLGAIPPCEFIPVAEETGLIVNLGEWVLEEACKHAIAISKRFNKDIPITINISVKQFTDSNFVLKTKEIIKKTKCNPSFLEFEITETVMQDMFSSMNIIKELKEIGVKFSMDDFGTGYSNLSVLSEMDIDILKIDRSFISKMTENDRSLSLVKTIITMGHSLGLEVVAEGIETNEQLNILKELDCDIGQGYFYSVPLPFQDIIK